MKKTALFGISLIAVATLAQSISVFAADTAPAPETTTGKVTLMDDPNSTHPGGDGDGDGGDTGQKGPFTLDHTVDYDFGTQMVTGKEMTLNATQTKPYTQVTDLRENNSGWVLSTKITDFKTEDGTKTLKGAQMTMPAGTAEAVDASNTSAAPTTSEVKLNASDATLFTAAKDAGIGSWMDKMYDTPTTLYIPAGATPGAYSATITWTLTDAPSGF
ncbi:WxL domain-containing protein [Lactobacillus sp. YT155]|uniref:WxL domain-containing protein n=1 Tax=Lactobacillus sp. YT155 TaxID=3060955 RepID=UPI0026602CF9|nr:WxL domain-containing protein [Lactobacillus sp. YT155]MDO1604596.1 WxL domain-containing protein [Lactobacillus sp. YT155]